MPERVMAAMSGGVDSSVAALLLRDAGHQVTGVTMCLGLPAADGRVACCGREAMEDARRVCGLLGIRHHVFDFSREMERWVVAPFLGAHASGLTPNPCAECNRRLKFGSLLARAEALGFDRLATGHYAGLGERSGRPILRRALDRSKDQSYFMWGVPQADLPRILFPLADMTKGEVRARALSAGLPVAAKKESQDLCFTAGRSCADFIEERTGPGAPGDIVDSRGKVLGRHRGLHRYTVGQRAGMGIGGGRPLYVQGKDMGANALVVGTREETKVAALLATDLNLSHAPAGRVQAQVRYRSQAVPCRLAECGEGLLVEFEEPVDAAAPGQSVAFYEEDALLGGGVIMKTFTPRGKRGKVPQ